MLVSTSQLCFRKATQSSSDVLVQTHSHKEPNKPLSVLLLTHQPPSCGHTRSSWSCTGQGLLRTKHLFTCSQSRQTHHNSACIFSKLFHHTETKQNKNVVPGLSETEVCTQLTLLKTKTASAAVESFIKVQFSSKENYTQDFSKLDKTEISLDSASAHFLVF